MDLFELLVLFFFIVLPLLQQLLQRGKDGGEGEGEALPPDDLEPQGYRREDGQAPAEPVEETSRAGPERGWSAGWGDWPGDELETVAEEEADEEEALRPETTVLPEAVRVSAPVVSLEPLHVDRSAEHARIHAIHDAPATRGRARSSRLASLLGGPRDLRRAIVLSEVLGPPTALRDRPHD